MEDSQSQPEHEEEMSFEQRFSQHFSTEGNLRSRRQAFGKGLFTKGGRSAFPPHRLVILSLVLLNAVLLIAAVVTGIYCAKAKDLEIPYLEVSPLIAEMNYFRNYSHIVKEKVKIQAELERQRASHVELRVQITAKKTISDRLQKKMETLQMEKTYLQNNKTNLEENCGRCLLRWLFLKSSCYYFSARVSDARKNWLDSRADCRSRGADMLVINDAVEQHVMTHSGIRPSYGSNWWERGSWIGLSRSNGLWTWVNNATEATYMSWKTGQPSEMGPQKGNCGAAYFNPQTPQGWYNADCHDHQLHWICEMEPN